MKLKKPIKCLVRGKRKALVLCMTLVLGLESVPMMACAEESTEIKTVEWESITEEEKIEYGDLWEKIPEEVVEPNELQEEVQEQIQENIETIEEANVTMSNTYTTVTNKALIFGTKDEVEVVPVTIGIPIIEYILSTEMESPEWEYRGRIRDIVLLYDIMVRQLNVTPTKASAIIANCCFEDTFTALTSSEAHSGDITNLSSRLGNGTRGFGIAQWTQKDRQNCLSDYYKDVNNAGYTWEVTSVIAESTCLYNEVLVSGLLGDLTIDDMSLEQATGAMACKFEAYQGWQNEWTITDGVYTNHNAARYNYAVHILEFMQSDLQNFDVGEVL